MLYPASAADPTQARSWFFPNPSAQPQLAIGLPQHLEQMSQLEAPYMNVANVPAHPPTHNCSGRFLESSLEVALRRRPEVPEIEAASCLAVSPCRSCSPPADGLCLWCPPANSSRQPAQRKATCDCGNKSKPQKAICPQAKSYAGRERELAVNVAFRKQSRKPEITFLLVVTTLSSSREISDCISIGFASPHTPPLTTRG
jgi:hypothetical protein